MKRDITVVATVVAFVIALAAVLWVLLPRVTQPSRAPHAADHREEGAQLSASTAAVGDRGECGARCAHEHAGHGEEEQEAETCGHAHGEHQEDGSEGGTDDLALSVAEVLAAECGHGTATHLCAECRYEVGVVKVGESLVWGGGGSGEGIVSIARAARTTADFAVDVTGEVGLDENRALRVSPQIPGVIRSVRVDIGDRVSEGDVLFEIESTELGRALSQYVKNRAMADLARRNYEREKALFERSISSEWDVIETQMVYEEYRAELEAAEMELRVLGLRDEDMDELERGIGDGRVGRLPTRAPMDGVIIHRDAVVGGLVDPGDDVMRLADLRTVWVWADIYEQDLATLIEAREGGPIPVEVSVRAFPGRTFRGEIDYLGRTMEERTRTVKVRATVVNDGDLLRPGMFCGIRILVSALEEAIAVPKVSLLWDGGEQFVFKHLRDDLFLRRAVKSGREFDDSVEILEGMEPGELVVADGAFLLKSDVLRSKLGAG